MLAEIISLHDEEMRILVREHSSSELKEIQRRIDDGRRRKRALMDKFTAHVSQQRCW